MFLSHIKTRQGYDFSLYFHHELLMSFLNAENTPHFAKASLSKQWNSVDVWRHDGKL